MSQQSDIRLFAGIAVYNLDNKEAIAEIKQRLASRIKTLLMFANHNFIVQCQNIKQDLVKNQVVIFNDGVSIDIASKLLYGERFKANLNGTDFTPELLLHLNAPKVVLIGAKPNVAKLAGEYMTRHFGAVVLATYDGYVDLKDTPQLIQQVNLLNPDLVLVGLGNPFQETWMLTHAESISAPLIVGVGALFDFLSSTIKRAPSWVRALKLEWLYRLCQEPKRLIKRYTVDGVTFFYLCFTRQNSVSKNT